MVLGIVCRVDALTTDLDHVVSVIRTTIHQVFMADNYFYNSRYNNPIRPNYSYRLGGSDNRDNLMRSPINSQSPARSVQSAHQILSEEKTGEDSDEEAVILPEKQRPVVNLNEPPIKPFGADNFWWTEIP